MTRRRFVTTLVSLAVAAGVGHVAAHKKPVPQSGSTVTLAPYSAGVVDIA